MKFGLRLIAYLGTSRELIQLAKLAEDAGFDSVWFPHDTFMHNSARLTHAKLTQNSRSETVLIRSQNVGYAPSVTGIATAHFLTAFLVSPLCEPLPSPLHRLCSLRFPH